MCDFSSNGFGNAGNGLERRISRVLLSSFNLCIDTFQLLYVGLYAEQNHAFRIGFVVGIVVDDSIIIAENMHRHFHMKKLPFKQAAIYAINEVGNPTILATFTVIAAILHQWLS